VLRTGVESKIAVPHVDGAGGREGEFLSSVSKAIQRGRYSSRATRAG
jgi:hypothetical protein